MHNDLVAEPAANVGRDHPHLTVIDAEELRQSHADDMRHLGRIVDDQLVAALVPMRQDRLAFHRHHRLTVQR
jgi:hypothetical protein